MENSSNAQFNQQENNTSSDSFWQNRKFVLVLIIIFLLLCCCTSVGVGGGVYYLKREKEKQHQDESEQNQDDEQEEENDEGNGDENTEVQPEWEEVGEKMLDIKSCSLRSDLSYGVEIYLEYESPDKEYAKEITEVDVTEEIMIGDKIYESVNGGKWKERNNPNLTGFRIDFDPIWKSDYKKGGEEEGMWKYTYEGGNSEFGEILEESVIYVDKQTHYILVFETQISGGEEFVIEFSDHGSGEIEIEEPI